MAAAPRTTPLALAVSALLLAAAAAVPASAAAADAPCLSELCVDAGGADGCFGDLQEALDAACVDGARVVVRAGFHDVNYVVAEGLSNLVLEGEAGAGEAVLSGLAAYEGLDYTMPKQTKRCRFDDNCKKNEVCRDIDQYRNLDWDDKRVHYRACIKDAGGKTDKKMRKKYPPPSKKATKKLNKALFGSGSDSAAQLTLLSSSNVTIRRLTFAPYSAASATVFLDAVAEARIEGCNFRPLATGDAVMADRVCRLVVHACEFEGTYSNGVYRMPADMWDGPRTVVPYCAACGGGSVSVEVTDSTFRRVNNPIRVEAISLRATGNVMTQSYYKPIRFKPPDLWTSRRSPDSVESPGDQCALAAANQMPPPCDGLDDMDYSLDGLLIDASDVEECTLAEFADVSFEIANNIIDMSTDYAIEIEHRAGATSFVGEIVNNSIARTNHGVRMISFAAIPAGNKHEVTIKDNVFATINEEAIYVRAPELPAYTREGDYGLLEPEGQLIRLHVLDNVMEDVGFDSLGRCVRIHNVLTSLEWDEMRKESVTSGLVLRGNRLKKFNRAGINLFKCHGATIEGNELVSGAAEEMNRASDDEHSAMNIQGCYQVRVAGNNVSAVGHAGIGIHIHMGSHDSNVRDNRVEAVLAAIVVGDNLKSEVDQHYYPHWEEWHNTRDAFLGGNELYASDGAALIVMPTSAYTLIRRDNVLVPGRYSGLRGCDMGGDTDYTGKGDMEPLDDGPGAQCDRTMAIVIINLTPN